MPKQCTHRKADGSRCRAPALCGAKRCFFHDPSTRDRHHAATVAGGRERNRPAAVLPPDTPDLPLTTVGDVVVALGLTVNQVRKGTVACNIGNCLGQLMQVLLRAIEGGELEQRIAALEAAQHKERK